MKQGVHMAAAAWLALLASGSHAAAQTAAEPCVTTSEAASLITVMMPAVLTAANQTCKSTLPASAYLRTKGDALVERYRVAGRGSLAEASAAFGKISGIGAALTPEMFETMAGPMVGGALAAAIKPKDCGRIDQVAALLDPLPANNLAMLVAVVMQMTSKSDKAPSPIPICDSAD